MHFTKKNSGEKRKDFVNNLKEKKLIYDKENSSHQIILQYFLLK